MKNVIFWYVWCWLPTYCEWDVRRQRLLWVWCHLAPQTFLRGWHLLWKTFCKLIPCKNQSINIQFSILVQLWHTQQDTLLELHQFTLLLCIFSNIYPYRKTLRHGKKVATFMLNKQCNIYNIYEQQAAETVAGVPFKRATNKKASN